MTALAIPSGIDAVTPQWLTTALCSCGTIADTAAVTGVSAERIAEDAGFSALLYRLRITGSQGLPPSLIVKLPAQSEARGAMEMLGGYQRELSFYQSVAGRAPLPTPRVYAALIDGVDFVLVMEDLADWVNADHLAGLSMRQARVAIQQLAGLHAWSVTAADSDALAVFPSLDTPVVRELLVAAFGIGWQIYRDKSAAPVPAAVARYAERFTEFAPQALAALTERRMLLHGDIRADNMFFDGDALKVVDYQFASLGCGVADIGYLVSQGLPVQARRGHDEELVRDYLVELAAQGVTDYGFDEAWRHYRMAVAYLLLFPVLALIGWDTMPQRSRDLCLTLTDRAVATIDDVYAIGVFA
jgi:aminoglycoside phosphotransferase (APT) family kinase protein